MEKFLDYALDPISEAPASFNNLAYPWLHGEDYSMIKYSIPHFADFSGNEKIAELLEGLSLPISIRIYIERLEGLLKEEPLKKLADAEKGKIAGRGQVLYYGYHIRGRYRSNILELIEIYSRLDAWYSMAMAVKTYELSFPTFIEQEKPLVDAEGLYHLLLQKPIAYDLNMDPHNNFCS